MDHWPFIWASYAIFFVVLLADGIGTVLARRRLLTQLRGRAVREKRRSGA